MSYLEVFIHAAAQNTLCQELITCLVISLNGRAIKDACQIVLEFMSVVFKRTFSLNESVHISVIEHKNASCKMTIYPIAVSNRNKH